MVDAARTWLINGFHRVGLYHEKPSRGGAPHPARLDYAGVDIAEVCRRAPRHRGGRRLYRGIAAAKMPMRPF